MPLHKSNCWWRVRAKAHVDSLKKRIGQRTPELEKSETDLLAALTPAGFADEKAFLEARLTHEAWDSFSSRAKELDNTGTELKAKQQEGKLIGIISHVSAMKESAFR